MFGSSISGYESGLELAGSLGPVGFIGTVQPIWLEMPSRRWFERWKVEWARDLCHVAWLPVIGLSQLTACAVSGVPCSAGRRS